MMTTVASGIVRVVPYIPSFLAVLSPNQRPLIFFLRNQVIVIHSTLRLDTLRLVLNISLDPIHMVLMVMVSLSPVLWTIKTNPDQEED